MSQTMFEPVYKEIFPFWDEISADVQGYLCRHSVAMTYLKGTTIHDGSECSGVFFIRSGCLRVYIMSENGKDITPVSYTHLDVYKRQHLSSVLIVQCKFRSFFTYLKHSLPSYSVIIWIPCSSVSRSSIPLLRVTKLPFLSIKKVEGSPDT